MREPSVEPTLAERIERSGIAPWLAKAFVVAAPLVLSGLFLDHTAKNMPATVEEEQPDPTSSIS